MCLPETGVLLAMLLLKLKSRWSHESKPRILHNRCKKQQLDQARLFEDMQARLCSTLEGATCHAASSSNSLSPTNELEAEEMELNPAPRVSVPVKRPCVRGPWLKGSRV